MRGKRGPGPGRREEDEFNEPSFVCPPQLHALLRPLLLLLLRPLLLFVPSYYYHYHYHYHYYSKLLKSPPLPPLAVHRVQGVANEADEGRDRGSSSVIVIVIVIAIAIAIADAVVVVLVREHEVEEYPPVAAREGLVQLQVEPPTAWA